MTAGIERRTVELPEIKRGVQLRVGHRYVLVVNGLESAEPGGGFVLEVHLHAAGGTPLANERVRIYDPDTGKPVGEPVVTDENGVLRARVPAEKEYQIHLDADAGEEHSDAFGEHDHPLAAHLPHPDEHAVLHVVLLDGKGEPLAGESVSIEDEHGASQEVKTDDGGQFQLVVEHGPFTLKARGSSLLAHSVLSGDLLDDGAPYRFVVS